MEEIEIRPTIKFVRAGALAIGVLALLAWGALIFDQVHTFWIPLAVTLLLLVPLYQWIQIRATLTVLTRDRIRIETGIISRSTRTLMLPYVQDVVVTQSLSDRLFHVGTIRIENAGASGHVLLEKVDAPRQLADKILERARTSH